MNIESDFETLIKLSIIGDSSVGKSNFLFKYIEGEISPLHVATIGFDYKSKIVTLPESKKRVKLQIWDTAGQEKYMSINKNLFQRVQGVVLMYDITKHETFDHLETWMNLIRQMTNEIPIILVGNKVDQEDSAENGRMVEYSEGEDFARAYNLEFFESSALNGTNVEKIIETISEIVLQRLKDGSSNNLVDVNNDRKNNQTKRKCC